MRAISIDMSGIQKNKQIGYTENKAPKITIVYPEGNPSRKTTDVASTICAKRMMNAAKPTFLPKFISNH